MPSLYLKPDDYTNFGLPATTTPAQVQQASIVLDSYLKRPEGLVYAVDNTGNPVYMKELPVSGTFTLTSPLSVGLNVSATITGPLQMLRRGAVLVADKQTPASVEALVVSAFNGATVTFQRVSRAHDAGITLDAGLVIEETKHLPTGRMQTLLSRTPLIQIHAAEGLYGPSRRGRLDRWASDMEEFMLPQAMAFAGGAPVPELVNLTGINFDSRSGQVWIPTGMLAPMYTDVTFRYVSGFPEAALPDIIKQVTANMILAQAQTPLRGNIKVFRAGDTQIERFMSTLLGEDDKAALRDFKATTYA